MDDAEFLDYLETKLGRRWTKEERARFQQIRPEGMALWTIHSIHKNHQRDNIKQVRDELIRLAIRRLS